MVFFNQKEESDHNTINVILLVPFLHAREKVILVPIGK